MKEGLGPGHKKPFSQQTTTMFVAGDSWIKSFCQDQSFQLAHPALLRGRALIKCLEYVRT